MSRADTSVLTDKTPLMFSEHDAIIQTLDRRSNGLFLGKEWFVDSVDAWNGVPLIFAQQHPEPDAWDKDAAAELQRIKGRLVNGKAAGTYIETTGHPRLMTTFELHDKEIEAGIADGTISTSNGFRTRHDGDKLIGAVQPHHILFFEEKDKGGPVPGDKGVVVLNTDTDADPIGRLIAFLKGHGWEPKREGPEEKEMAEAKELELKLATREQELAQANLAYTQLQTKMAEMGEAVKAKDAEIAGLRTEKLAFIAKEKDAKWGAFKSKHIPPGMVAGDKEKEARAEFEADPLTFMEKIMDHRERDQEGSDDEGDIGVQFTAHKGKPKAAKFEDELRAVGVPCISFSGIEEGK
jgi:hypothetical protein